LQNLREAIQAQLGRTARVLHSPLLPADVDDEREPVISRSPRDKHGGASIAVSLEWRASVQGKRCLIGSVRCIGKEDPSVTSCDRQGSIAARSPNGSGLTRFLAQCSGAENDFATLFRRISIAPLVGGFVRAAGVCSKRSGAWLYGQFFQNLERLLGNGGIQNVRWCGLCCPLRAPPVDPATGRLISPIVAAAL